MRSSSSTRVQSRGVGGHGSSRDGASEGGRYTGRMRLVGQLYITVSSSRVKRDPTFIEKLKRGLGGQVDLDTDEVQNRVEGTAVVDAVLRALGRLGVGNALSLVIDGTVVFQDVDSKADDLRD